MSDYVGTETFSYTVSDGNGGADTATVNVTVAPSDDDDEDVARSAGTVMDCWTTSQEQMLTGTLRDAQDSSLATYSIVTSGTKGTVKLTDPTTGAFEYVPQSVGERGEDMFIYQIDDPAHGVSQKTAKVIIVPKLIPAAPPAATVESPPSAPL